MNEPQPLLLPLPDELPDEAIAKLLELVYELARALENRYTDQLHRYYSPPDDDQLDLWGNPHDYPPL